MLFKHNLKKLFTNLKPDYLKIKFLIFFLFFNFAIFVINPLNLIFSHPATKTVMIIRTCTIKELDLIASHEPSKYNYCKETNCCKRYLRLLQLRV
jgi:hypothetical protein